MRFTPFQVLFLLLNAFLPSALLSLPLPPLPPLLPPPPPLPPPPLFTFHDMTLSPILFPLPSWGSSILLNLGFGGFFWEKLRFFFPNFLVFTLALIIVFLIAVNVVIVVIVVIVVVFVVVFVIDLVVEALICLPWLFCQAKRSVRVCVKKCDSTSRDFILEWI